MTQNWLIFGLGYSGRAIASLAAARGYRVVATSRGGASAPAAIEVIAFASAEAAVAAATHIVATAPPGEAGDPVLARYGAAIAGAPHLSWIGYLSTTGVYGDRAGGWVDEATEPRPGAARSRRRLAAELAWREVAAGRPLDLLRLAGIYGPGRSALDDIRSGHARRVVKPGHAFGRIHRDDIGRAVLAGAEHPPAGTRVLNLSDDHPTETATVIEEAARLLGVKPPIAIPFAEAEPGMSEMGRSFWAENRRVSSAATKAALGIDWAYPSYREGLRAILAEERADDLA